MGWEGEALGAGRIGVGGSSGEDGREGGGRDGGGKDAGRWWDDDNDAGACVGVRIGGVGISSGRNWLA